jgi:hypothetical protein
MGLREKHVVFEWEAGTRAALREVCPLAGFCMASNGLCASAKRQKSVPSEGHHRFGITT